MSKEDSVKKLIADLKRLAPSATQGEWWIDSHGHAMVAFSDDKDIHTVFVTDPEMGPAVRHESTGNLSRWQNDVDATYIATACPQNILKLIERIEWLEKHLETQRVHANMFCAEANALRKKLGEE